MLTLVIGGSASGKSEYAERHVTALGGRRIYLATMEPFGEEAHARIEKHRAMRRDRGFETVERYTGLEALQLPAGSNVLLEDLGNLVANELFSENGGGADAVRKGIDAILAQGVHLTVVTNDVFSGGRNYSAETVQYMKELAGIGRYLAGKADLVAEVFCGIPDLLKGTGVRDGGMMDGTAGGIVCGTSGDAVCFPKTHCDRTGNPEKKMIFVTGPLFAGKQEYIQEAMGWTEEEFRRRAVRDVQELAAEVARKAHKGSAEERAELAELADELARFEVVIATETGGGIVPSDPGERRAREAAGILSRLIALRADTVVRVSCGLPQVLKGEVRQINAGPEVKE